VVKPHDPHLSTVFSSLAASDVVEVLDGLVLASTALTSATAGGIALADRAGELHVVTSTHRMSISADAAFAVLRQQARSTDQRIHDVVARVMQPRTARTGRRCGSRSALTEQDLSGTADAPPAFRSHRRQPAVEVKGCEPSSSASLGSRHALDHLISHPSSDPAPVCDASRRLVGDRARCRLVDHAHGAETDKEPPVGHLIYDSSTRMELEDRALAHLQVVITSKLRRHESFTFSWRNPPTEGDGRRTLWIAPEVRSISSSPAAVPRRSTRRG
jgi:hypothetical protein